MKKKISHFRELTDEQSEFVRSLATRIELVAGPGTGKTFSVVKRVKWMLHRGVLPSEVLLLTFTNAARESIEHGFDDVADKPRISTIHAYAYGWLVGMWLESGRQPLRLANEEESEQIIQSLFEGPFRRSDARNMGISRVREIIRMIEAKGPMSVPMFVDGLREVENFTEIWNAYTFRHYERGLMPMSMCVSMALGNHDKIMRYTQGYAGIRHVIVDEAHDITKVERHYVDMIVRQNNATLTMIRDPRQQIFEWRGSDAADAEVHGGKRFDLTITHRFGGEAVTLANQIAAHAATEALPIRSVGGDTRVSYTRLLDPEAPWLNDVVLAVNMMEKEFKDLVVLTRTNHEAETINNVFVGKAVARTVHQAKGKEWDGVVLVANPFWPGPKSSREDWRVLFVGATRARKHLHIVTGGSGTFHQILEHIKEQSHDGEAAFRLDGVR